MKRAGWLAFGVATGTLLLGSASLRRRPGVAPSRDTSRSASGESSRLALPLVVVCLAYLVALTAGEVATTWVDARLGMMIDTATLVTLLLVAAYITREAHRNLLLALSLGPLIRILSLSMPLKDVQLEYWYIVVGAPMVVACFVVARTGSLSRKDLGLSLSAMPAQLAVACTGFLFGVAEYFILKPEPLVERFSWQAVLLPALILLVGTGFTEELTFRGVMQSASRNVMGKGAILYVSVAFAVLHLGYRSAVDVAFVFVIGLFFAWVVMKTGSIVGTTLSHGIANISLYLIVPFLGLAAATGSPAVPQAEVAARQPALASARHEVIAAGDADWPQVLPLWGPD